MIVQKFDPTVHQNIIEEMCVIRGIPVQTVSDLPNLGIIAMLERTETPVAMGFLRKCEGDYALFDGIITNSELNGAYRNEGLDLVVSTLIQEAKSMNIKLIIGWSSDNSTIMRSQRHGFNAIDHRLFLLPL